jgi:hypothetical protein
VALLASAVEAEVAVARAEVVAAEAAVVVGEGEQVSMIEV